MDVYNKQSMMILSIAQIVLSIIFFTLGMVDGFKIRYGLVSLLFTPCWITVLSLPIGVMGVVLACRRTPSSLLVTALWSVSVACILFSAMTAYIYHIFAFNLVLFIKHDAENLFDSDYFAKKGTKLEYTDEEKNALAVFILVIIFSIIEITLAAAIAKISSASHQTPQTLQPSPMYYMHNQASQDGGQTICRDTGVPQMHNGTAANQRVLMRL